METETLSEGLRDRGCMPGSRHRDRRFFGDPDGNERGTVEIEQGQEFFFRYEDVSGNKYETSLSYKNMYQEVKPGDNILVADGKLIFEVTEVIGQDIKTNAVVKGTLGSRKNVNVPGVSLDQPALIY